MAGPLQQLDYSVLQQCMHCGMCLPTCPTFDATKRERHGPRGRIALMRAVADGELQAGAGFAEEMSYCLGCLACQTACPAGVDYAGLFEAARAHVEQSGLPQKPSRILWRALTLRFLFMRPWALRLVARFLRIHQRTGLDRLVRRLGLTRLLPPDLRRLEPQAPRISACFSDECISEEEAPGGAARYRVALLTGCIQDIAFSDINRDTADVLLANGCHVHTPPAQGCCGSLHGHNGEPALAAERARRMIDQMPPGGYDAIITNAGGCGAHLRHYSRVLAGDPEYAERAAEWDRKVRDIHEWLVEIGIRKPAAGGEMVVTYHESCHLAHGQKVVRQPREVLKSIPGLKLVELPESNWCCGSAGVYSITQPEQSEALLRRKVAHIAGTGARWLATSNPGCHLQVANGLRAAGVAVEVVQPVTLLARAYRAEKGARGMEPA